MAKHTKIIGGLTEPELVKLILVGSPELKNEAEVVALCAQIENYIRGEGKQRSFYEVVLKNLNGDNPSKLNRRIIKALIDNLGIWLPEEYYKKLPVVRPYVIRDPTCRIRVEGNLHDEWSKPNDKGYLRDDNSLIKSIVKSMAILRWPIMIPEQAKISGGFTASHVWRKDVDYETGDDFVSRSPDLNSFVPNLVWLPTEVSKMTDREGWFAQRYIQAISIGMFKEVKLPRSIGGIVRKIWAQLPEPGDLGVSLPDIEKLPRFEMKDILVKNKVRDVNVVAKFIDKILQNSALPTGRGAVTTRYSQYLPKVDIDSLKDLFERLENYAKALGVYDPNVTLQKVGDFEDHEDGLQMNIATNVDTQKTQQKKKQQAVQTKQKHKDGHEDQKAAHQVNVRLRSYLSTLNADHQDVQNLCDLDYTYATFGLPTFNALVPDGVRHEHRRYYKQVQKIGTRSFYITNEWHVKQLLQLREWLNARGVTP